MPATAHISSLSEVSPEMPQAPTILPPASLISTPPGLVTMRPPLAAASMVKNCGVFAARLASVREPKPMPSAPQALPKAMSNRRIPDLSSRLNATRWPPASSTATESGANLASRAVLSATSRMVLACASVRDDMLAPEVLDGEMTIANCWTCHPGAARACLQLLQAVADLVEPGVGAERIVSKACFILPEACCRYGSHRDPQGTTIRDYAFDLKTATAHV